MSTVRSLQRSRVSRARQALQSVPSLYARFCTTTLVFRFDGVSPDRQDQQAIAGTEWLVANNENLRELFRGDEERCRFFQRFLESGCFGVLLAREGKWIAYGWCKRPGKGCPPHVAPGAIAANAHWIFYCHTRSEFRGRGVYRQLLRQIIAVVRKNDGGPVYIDALPGNTASQAAILSTGFSACGISRTLKLWIPRTAQIPLTGSWAPHKPHPTRTLHGNTATTAS